MTTLVDHSIGFGLEATYNVHVPPTRHFEYLDGSGLDYDPAPNQGEGLRQGSKFPRADRRSPGVGVVNGKVLVEAATKGLQLPFSWAFGTTTHTNVSGSLYQTVHTATTASTTLPSFTVQEGVVDASGNTTPLTFGGCTVDSLDIKQPQGGIVLCTFGIHGRSFHVTRTFADGATTNTSPILSSPALALFTLNDVGRSVTGTGIPAATTIISYQSPTQVTMSANASATGSSLSIVVGLPYTTPVYPGVAAALFTSTLPSSGALTLGGAITVPTTTTLASSTGTIAPGVRDWVFALDNGLDKKRETVGDRRQQTTGARKATITMTLEYDATTGAMMRDAQASQATIPLLLQSGALESIGQSTALMQLAVPAAKIDKGAIPMPGKGDTVVTSVQMTVLDGLVAGQALYMVMRTADTAI